MATCDATTLMASAKCLMCLNGKQMVAARLQVLCELKAKIDSAVAIVTELSLGPTAQDLIYAAMVSIDLDGADYQTIALTGNIDLSATLNRPTTGFAKAVAVILEADGSNRNITYNANWTFVGIAPTQIAANKLGVMSITAVGPNETDVICAYQEEA